MSLTFTQIIEEEGKYWAIFSSPMEEVRIPFDQTPSQDELDEAIAKHEWEAELLSFKGEDRIYKDGALVRVDLLTDQGIIRGECSGRRAPYNQDHVSIYYLESPSSQLLSQWGVRDTNKLTHWYGIKTLIGGESFLKVVRFKASWPNEPELSGRIYAYASVFSEDGAESSIKDLYINAESEEMKQWCVDNNLTYPLPSEETKRPWCFGVYWNSDTGAIDGVKGYVRYT